VRVAAIEATGVDDCGHKQLQSLRRENLIITTEQFTIDIKWGEKMLCSSGNLRLQPELPLRQKATSLLHRNHQEQQRRGAEMREQPLQLHVELLRERVDRADHRTRRQ
jgi:hypothetical protein